MHEHRYSAIMSLSLAVLGLGACTTEGSTAPPLDEAPARVAVPLETTVSVSDTAAMQAPPLGAEVAIARHLADGDEYNVSLRKLLRHGQQLFEAVFTPQEGGGRPLSKGTGDPVSDP